jgi:hypothetical protein
MNKQMAFEIKNTVIDGSTITPTCKLPIFDANSLRDKAVGDLTGVSDGNVLIWDETNLEWTYGTGSDVMQSYLGATNGIAEYPIARAPNYSEITWGTTTISLNSDISKVANRIRINNQGNYKIDLDITFLKDVNDTRSIVKTILSKSNTNIPVPLTNSDVFTYHRSSTPEQIGYGSGHITFAGQFDSGDLICVWSSEIIGDSIGSDIRLKVSGARIFVEKIGT